MALRPPSDASSHSSAASSGQFSTASSVAPAAKLPEPYTLLNNPDKTMRDRLASFLLPYQLPLHQVQDVSPLEKVESSATLCHEGLRELADKLFHTNIKKVVSRWKQISKCDIAETDYFVPRPENLLQGWGLADVASTPVAPNSDHIRVKLLFPVSVLGAHGAVASKVTEFGCLSVALPSSPTHLSCFPETVPILLCFHGGGFVLGNKQHVYQNDIMDVIAYLLEPDQRWDGGGTLSFILACVDYSLAPEYPFPVAIEESLAVASHLSKHYSNPLHVVGAAGAGANLALVCALESYRRLQENNGHCHIQSALILSPMMDPAADSISYYMNAKSTHISVSWLRWCWQSYLRLPASSKDGALPPDNNKKNKRRNKDMRDSQTKLTSGSNRTTWDACVYRHTSAERLIHPTVDLPSGLDQDRAPEIVLVTNRADPLYDEGVALAHKLQQAKAKLTHLDQKGSQYLGSYLDSKAFSEVGAAWRKCKTLFERQQPVAAVTNAV